MTENNNTKIKEIFKRVRRKINHAAVTGAAGVIIGSGIGYHAGADSADAKNDVKKEVPTKTLEDMRLSDEAIFREGPEKAKTYIEFLERDEKGLRSALNSLPDNFAADVASTIIGSSYLNMTIEKDAGFMLEFLQAVQSRFEGIGPQCDLRTGGPHISRITCNLLHILKDKIKADIKNRYGKAKLTEIKATSTMQADGSQLIVYQKGHEEYKKGTFAKLKIHFEEEKGLVDVVEKMADTPYTRQIVQRDTDEQVKEFCKTKKKDNLAKLFDSCLEIGGLEEAKTDTITVSGSPKTEKHLYVMGRDLGKIR